MGSFISKVMGFVRNLVIGLVFLSGAGYFVADSYVYPFESYFDVGAVVVDTPSRTGGITLDTSAHPLRDFIGGYKVVGKSLTTGNTVCESPFQGFHPYRAESTYPEPPIEMSWWEGPGGDCSVLPPGTYKITTCWTVANRPFLLGPVTGCVDSNYFVVRGENE